MLLFIALTVVLNGKIGLDQRLCRVNASRSLMSCKLMVISCVSGGGTGAPQRVIDDGYMNISLRSCNRTTGYKVPQASEGSVTPLPLMCMFGRILYLIKSLWIVAFIEA